MEIRQFTEKDIDRVFEVQQEAFRPLYEKYQDPINPYLETKEAILRKCKRDTGYVAVIDDIVCGFVRIKVHRDNPAIGIISGLSVHPDYQGRKIAQRLLSDIENKYPEFISWELDTILEEKCNCHLYEKLGYRDTGRREYVNDRMTLIFYKK